MGGEHDGELIVWGEWRDGWGEDGGEYVVSDRGARIGRSLVWEPLPDPPFDTPTAHADGVVVDGHLVIVGMPCTKVDEAFESLMYCSYSDEEIRAADLDLATNSWTVLAPPFTRSGDDEVNVHATGSSVLVSVSEEQALSPSRWYSFDPASGSWSQEAPPPVTARSVCATLDTVMVVETAYLHGGSWVIPPQTIDEEGYSDPQGDASRVGMVRASTYGSDGTWTESAPPLLPDGVESLVEIECDADRIRVVVPPGECGDGSRWELVSGEISWRVLEPSTPTPAPLRTPPGCTPASSDIDLTAFRGRFEGRPVVVGDGEYREPLEFTVLAG